MAKEKLGDAVIPAPLTPAELVVVSTQVVEDIVIATMSDGSTVKFAL